MRTRASAKFECGLIGRGSFLLFPVVGELDIDSIDFRIAFLFRFSKWWLLLDRNLYRQLFLVQVRRA